MSVFSIPFLFLALVMSSTLTIFRDFLVHVCKSSNILLLLWCGLLAATFYLRKCPPKVYLVDFSCYKPDPECICSKEMFVDIQTCTGHFQNESIDFSRRILDRSGFGQKTYMAKPLLKIPQSICIAEARKETESVIFGAIDDLLFETKVQAEDIRILVTNCSIFNPTPSLSSMVVNHYKLRHNILSYNLSGMGCSAGLLAIDLAKQLLQVHPNSYALVVSTENITIAGYFGNDRSMLVSNCLFRMGGAAILLSNLSTDSSRSKYHLRHTIRTHKGSQDHSYNVVYQNDDETQRNIIGVALSKDLTNIAGDALKANISILGRYVLPLLEQLKFLSTSVVKKYFNTRMKLYTPNFKLAFEHFCIHTGGKAVQVEMQKILELSDWHMEPSRMTLYRYGNTSSSSVWYVLAYCEAKGRIKKGDRIWQIAFGSGFKCNSVVLCALRNIDPIEEDYNPWIDEIHQFPVNATS